MVAMLTGVLRGLIADGVRVSEGLKCGVGSTWRGPLLPTGF